VQGLDNPRRAVSGLRAASVDVVWSSSWFWVCGTDLLTEGQKREPTLTGASLFFFFTLATGPRRSLGLKLTDTRVYEPQIRARLGTEQGAQASPMPARRPLGVFPDV